MHDKAIAVWTVDSELRLISAFQQQATKPKHVAAGGKNLREPGWQCVLEALQPFGFYSTGQLQSKWRRMKCDFADYVFLLNLSGFGDGFSDDKWVELDAGRPKSKLSRFKDKPYQHWEAMSSVIGDSMARGDNIVSASGIVQGMSTAEDVVGAVVKRGVARSSSVVECGDVDLDQGNLSAAQKRATILHQLKKNRKRGQQSQDTNERFKVIQRLSDSVADLVRLYAMKNGLEAALENETHSNIDTNASETE
ncbi:hypothetical protein DYB38_010268 [Aphanomyces astaci]|uniref:Myb/SANT-like domain-containing protein n=1 Tax=Aphanomyces astaci TaxID=112090 RepID=A0A397CJQ0_APHAT|nr:hypothetical protein DYB38_010268 [Aphanomyces astaci]